MTDLKAQAVADLTKLARVSDVARAALDHMATLETDLAAALARVAELEGELRTARAEPRILARRVLTWFDLGDDRSTFPPQLMADLGALAEPHA